MSLLFDQDGRSDYKTYEINAKYKISSEEISSEELELITRPIPIYTGILNSDIVITEKTPSKTTILLHSGNYFDFENFEKSRYTIDDIAHGLSMTCRFAGQCIHYYSVAEHSYWVSYLVPEEYAFIGLMHDASEAFLGDIPKPLKNLLPDYMKIEKNVEEAMMNRFKIEFPFPPEIKIADRKILLTEQHQNMNKTHWQKSDVEPADIKLEFWTPEMAKFKFLQRFYELSKEPL